MFSIQGWFPFVEYSVLFQFIEVRQPPNPVGLLISVENCSNKRPGDLVIFFGPQQLQQDNYCFGWTDVNKNDMFLFRKWLNSCNVNPVSSLLIHNRPCEIFYSPICIYIYILICISYIYISIESRYMSRCFPLLYNENRGSLSPLDMSAKCCLDHPKHV